MLTFDPQSQGQSDTFGASPDHSEGVAAQTDGHHGDYLYVKIDTSPDAVRGPGAALSRR